MQKKHLPAIILLSTFILGILAFKFLYQPKEDLKESLNEVTITSTNEFSDNACPFEEIQISLWNSAEYKTNILYENCNNKKQADFLLANGNALLLSNQQGDFKKILEFQKLSPNTVEESITLMATKEDPLPESCYIKETTPNQWRILKSSEQEEIDCGQYSQALDHTIDKYFTVLDDSVLVFVDKWEGSLSSIIKMELIKD